MNIASGLSFWFLVWCIHFSLCDICFENELCFRKCCSSEEMFNRTSKSCQAKVSSSRENVSSLRKFAVCLEGIRLPDFKEKSTILNNRHECAEEIMDGLAKKVIVCVNQTELTIRTKIPVIKCCLGQHEIYDIGNQACASYLHENPSIRWPPPVHSLSTNQIVNYSENDFHVTHDLIKCPPGFIAQSSTDFTLYEDGSLKLSNTSELEHSTFCMESVTSTSGFAARFCIRDPCYTKNCVRKCCPHGFLLNSQSKTCETTNVEFVVDYRNESGVLVNISNQITIRSGTKPNCSSSGYNLLDPENFHQDEFYLLPDGKLYVPEYPLEFRTIDEYCIEDFKVSDDIQKKALICFAEQIEPLPEEKLVLSLFPYLMFISSIFLIATFVVYAIIPEIRNIHGATIMCHVSSLATTYICLGIIQLDPTLPKASCVGLAIVVHFSFLASFMWLNVMSFDIWITFSDLRPRSTQSRHRINRRFIYYSLYAWGVPLMIVILGQILDNIFDSSSNVLRPQFGVMKCWFSDQMAMMAYLYGPIAAILLANIVFFILTALRLHRARMDTAFATKNKQNKQNYVVIFSLFVLMGVTWVTEVITANINGGIYYSIPTDILNILTGVFIFIIFVCKKKVRKLLRQKLKPVERLMRRGKQSTSSATHDASSSSNVTRLQRGSSDSTRKPSLTNVTHLTESSSRDAS